MTAMPDGGDEAALIARDVLGWPASETAALLGTSVAAANSALQRARQHAAAPARAARGLDGANVADPS